MRSTRAIAWSLMVFVGTLAAATMAYAGSFDLVPVTNLNAAFQWGYGSNLPGGTYQNSCQDIRMNGTRLEARCQTTNGRWRDTSIDMRNCGGGTVANNDGRLQCDNSGWQGGQVGGWQGQGGYGYGQGAVPQGDYAQSCQNIRMNGSRLEARCQTVNGRWRDSSLDMRQCGNGNVTNNDGRLQCGYSGGWQGNQVGGWQGGPGGNWQGVPQGAFTETCQDIRTKGDDLRARCRKIDGSWHDTSLDDYRKCRGQIVNEDGNLRCRR